MDHRPYVEVAVRTPMARRLFLGDEAEPEIVGGQSLGLTFHYAIPPTLAGRLQAGHLVLVPFGKQELQGIVLDLLDQLPDSPHTVRPLLSLVLPDPVCTAQQLALARWLSKHTLSPILDCVLLMLPPGVAQKAEPVLSLTPLGHEVLSQESTPPPVAGPQQMPLAESLLPEPQPYFPQLPDLKGDQHALLMQLQARELIPLRVLRREAAELARGSVIDPLIAQGLVERQRRIVEPPARPKRGQQVTLIANDEQVTRVLPSLGRASKQADVLAWLADHAPGNPTLAEVCAAVGCSPAPVRSLVERGWVRIDEAEHRLELLLTETQAQIALAQDLQRAPAQAAALGAIAAAAQLGEKLDETALRQAHGIAAQTLTALERRGYVRRNTVEATASLLLSPEDVPERLIELRGGEKYQPILEALAAEEGPVWLGWLYAEIGTDLKTLRELAQAGLISLIESEIWRDPLAGKEFVADKAPPLTPDQAQVWTHIQQALRQSKRQDQTHPPTIQPTNKLTHQQTNQPTNQPSNQPSNPPTIQPLPPPPAYLLHGVTGSGKTEIYLRAIEATLQAGRQAIALVPEIALTPQTVRRFAARFQERVTVYHSGLSVGERYDVWRKARAGEVDVVVGTRSALFLPLPRLGLLVLDEEHDPSYKEGQRQPRYHAREAALHLARLADAVVILGSATPSLEAYHAAQLGRLQLLQLPRRILGHAKAILEQQKRLHLRQTVYRPVGDLMSEARYTELPKVEVVDLRQELRAGNRSMFSRALQQALGEVLAAGQQAILFLNRRGSHTFVMCRDCGHVLACEHCDVPLTYHNPSDRRRVAELVCHHCGRRSRSPERCPECASRRIRYLGAGTEKIAELVQGQWPAARVVRWDRDVTGRKGSHDAILKQFTSGQANVMVGTQMIAKGLDLPLVTLVGVISADVGLYLPDFRAAERTFQLLTQVAGRAGRSLLGGRVIVQSYRPEHYVVQAARRHDYLDFYQQELSFRRQLGYPPFRRLAKLLHLQASKEKAQAEAEALARGLSFSIADRGLSGVDLIGPAPCFFGRERGKYRWQIIVRAADPAAFLRTVTIPQGWRVDVDPISLL